MGNGFPPEREAELMDVSENFKEKTSSNPTEYGLSAIQAASYAAAHDAMVSARALTLDPETKSPKNVELKNVAKRELVEKLRLYAGIATRSEGMTNAKRIDLGLPPRDFEPTPIGPPVMEPTLAVLATKQNTVSLSITDPANPNRRGRPDGVDGIAVFTHVGETAPTTAEGWTFESNTTRTRVNVVLPTSTPAGAKVWFTAFYFNERKQSGPAAAPISTYLPGGAAMAG